MRAISALRVGRADELASQGLTVKPAAESAGKKKARWQAGSSFQAINAQIMNALISTVNPVTMTSREIADLTGKAHFNVLVDVRKMLLELGEDELKFQGIYRDSMNREQVEFHLDRELTDVLLTGYSAVLRRKVIARWRELESGASPSVPQTLSAALRLAADQAERIEVLAFERDRAIATKAQIGSRREATAMASAASAKREAAKLKDQLGFSARHATILQVEDAIGADYDFVPLRRWCKVHEVTPETVPDKRYPKGVKAWPAAAWMDVYGVDLAELFGEVAA